MSKKMLINATHPEESRVATVEDGLLTDLDIESEGREMTRGNIYKATVVRVEQGLQAAFIDYGAERLGFLQMGELHPSYFAAFETGEGKGRPRINDLLRRGQEILVQVVKEERGTKGAALTTYLSLPGRYMVLMPDSDTKGVSRKIEEEAQRKKLKEAMKSLDLPAQMGYIVRTAGIGQTKEELKRDFDYLVRVWQNIQELGRRVKAPALVYKESNLVIRSIRDYFTSDMDEVLVDDPEVYEEAKEFFQQVMPEYVRLVKLHQERRPIFSRYQIEEQIETLSRNKVPLTSGGSIVIDATEALVAIDVNSGKMAGEQGVEGTAYKTNIEAAAEVGRQLRLRDLGGLIVIDFIDMRDRKHIREVEKVLKDSLKNDKARVTVGKISQFGLLEMSRQRIKATLAEGSYLSCPNCGGSGRVKSAEAQAVGFLRKLHAAIARGQVERVEGEVPIDVAHYLLNTKREELLEMERRYQVSIFIRARKSFVASQFELIVHKREKGEARDDLYAPVTAASAPHHPVAAPVAAPVAEILPAVAASPPAAESAAGDLPHPLAPTPAGEEPSPDLAAEGEAKRKRKRRRRKKKKGEPGESMEGPEELTVIETETEDEPEEDATDSAVAAAGTESGEEPQKRKRKRRRRKKKPGDESTAVLEATGEGTTPEPSQILEPAPAEQTEVLAAAPPVRNRRRKPAAEMPAAEMPAAEKPAAEMPAAKKPAAKKPAAKKPAAKKPAAKKPVAEKPAAKKPAAKKPAAEKPAAKKPAAEKPATGETATEKPEAKKRMARKPAAKSAALPGPDSAATGAEIGADQERRPRKRVPRKKTDELPSE